MIPMTNNDSTNADIPESNIIRDVLKRVQEQRLREAESEWNDWDRWTEYNESVS